MFEILVSGGYTPDEAMFYLDNHAHKIGSMLEESFGIGNESIDTKGSVINQEEFNYHAG